MNKELTGSAAPLDEMMEGRVAPQLTGRDLFKVLFRRKWVVLILFLTTSVFVAWNASQIPTEYRATAQVLLNRGMRNSALDRNISLLTWDETVNSELQIAESQPVLDEAQSILNHQAISEGVEAIAIEPGHVFSKLLGESNVIGIEYMSLDWEEVRPVANAIAKAYITVHDDLFALPNVKEFFATEVARAEQRLEELTTRKQEVQEDGAVIRLETQQDYLVRAMSVNREHLVDVEREYQAAKMEIEQIRRLFYEENVDLPFETKRFEDESGMLRTVYQYRGELLRLEQERVDLLTRFTEQHPRIVGLDERIVDVADRMREETEAIIRIKERNLSVIHADATTLRDDLAELEEQLRLYPVIEKELENLDLSIRLVAKEYQTLLENQIQISVATVSSRDYTLSMLSDAGSPVATNPQDPIRLALVPMFSLLVGVSLAFFLETMDHSLKSREDVERHLELPVLTSIPKRRGLSRARV